MPDLAVAFVARDRFASAPIAIEALSRQLGEGSTIYIADPGYPDRLRREIMGIAQRRGAATEFLDVGRYATTNHSWNEIARVSNEPTILYIENDVLVEEGCVAALTSAVEAGEADIAIAEVYEADQATVHFRPSVSDILSLPGGGHRIVLDRGRSDQPDQSERRSLTPVSIFERHCFALPRRAARTIGDLDELMFCRTDLDFSFACHQASLRAVMVQDARTHLEESLDLTVDGEFYEYRWDLHRVQCANDRLIAKWNLVGYKKTIDHAHVARARLTPTSR